MIVLRRLLSVVPTILLVVLIAMLLLELTPIEPARILAGEFATEEDVARVNERFGLDRPLAVRYADYVTDALRGDLGLSYATGVPVRESLLDTFPVTAWLAALTLVIVLVASVLVGVLSAVFRDRWVDRFLTGATSLFMSVPPFVVALILITLVAVQRRWFPVFGYVRPDEGFGEFLRHLILPAVALSLRSLSECARQVRGAIINVLEEDYLQAQYAKGLPTRRIWLKHVSKNAAIPFVTVFGLQAGNILGGSVVIEIVFGLPGFGNLAATSVFSRDLPMIQGFLLVSAVMVLVANMLVDLSYLYFDPRTRHARA